MATTTIEDVEARLDAVRADYEEVTGTELPATLKEAMAQRWNLVVNGAEFAFLTAYLPEQQRQDDTRAIPLSKVIRIMQDMEQELVKAMIPTPSQIAGELGVKTLKSALPKRYKIAVWAYQLGKALLDLVKQFLQNPGGAVSIVKQLLSILCAYFMDGLSLLAVPDFAKWIGRGYKVRQAAEKKLRESVLPQRTVTRYRVRKESRR